MNEIRDQKYFSLDLELNNLKNGKTPRIIEVGIAIGSPLSPDSIMTVNWYLDPKEPISPFISNLTGIDDVTISSKAVTHQTVAKELGALLDVHKCYVNPVTWGQGDAKELKNEFSERGIEFPYFGRRILDVKDIFVYKQIVKGITTSSGLKKAMGMYGLKFKGEAHRAAVDAENTLRFFFHLIKMDRNIIEFVEVAKRYK
jgi:inhibitor of KinA sporulation pathway (predicted exonuclease)